MPRGIFRSRTYRRVSKKLPGGKTVVAHEKRSPKKAHCSVCGKLLLGVPSKRPYRMQQLPLSQKRPQRPYGGVLCSSCTRSRIKGSVRV